MGSNPIRLAIIMTNEFEEIGIIPPDEVDDTKPQQTEQPAPNLAVPVICDQCGENPVGLIDMSLLAPGTAIICQRCYGNYLAELASMTRILRAMVSVYGDIPN